MPSTSEVTTVWRYRYLSDLIYKFNSTALANETTIYICLAVGQDSTTPALKQSAVFQVIFDDDVGDGIHDELHVAGVRRTSEVRVDVLRRAVAVHTFESRSNVRAGFFVCVTT